MKEIWKDIPGYKGSYQVSNLGNVRSLDRYVPDGRWKGNRLQRGKMLRKDITHRGYATALLYKNAKTSRKEIHVLVALAFIGPRPKKHHVHHKDHNKLNNYVSNLEYVHCSQHTRSHNQGESFHANKLTEKDVHKIRTRLARGEYQKDIAADYGVSRSTIGEIKRGRTWTHI